MSRIIEWIFVTRQEIVVLPTSKPTVAEVLFVAIKIRYSESRLL